MLLDRDHALTELGVEQAEALNHRWKEFEEIRHAEIAHSPKKAQRPLPEKKSSPTNCVFGSKILCSFFSLLLLIFLNYRSSRWLRRRTSPTTCK